MTDSEIKLEIKKIIECSSQRLDGIDLFLFFYNDLYNNIDRFFDILNELVRGKEVKKEIEGLKTYYIIN